MPLTSIQALHARRLAAAHYHSWGVCPATEGLTDRDAIRAATLEAHGDDLPGIDAPCVDGDDVVHTTTSGRLWWRVARDGSVSFEVRRPAGVVLRATVREVVVSVTRVADPVTGALTDAHVVDSAWRAESRVEGDYLARHVDALLFAVDALGVLGERERVRFALLLRAFCREDES